MEYFVENIFHFVSSPRVYQLGIQKILPLNVYYTAVR